MIFYFWHLSLSLCDCIDGSRDLSKNTRETNSRMQRMDDTDRQITEVLHVKRSFPARQYRGSLVVGCMRVIVFDIDETSAHIVRASSRFMSHLRALRCNHWIPRIPHSAASIAASRGRLVRAKETSAVLCGGAPRKGEKCELNRCIEAARVGCEVIRQPDPSLRVWYTRLTVPHGHEAESEPQTARSDAPPPPSPPPCRSARNRFSTRGTTRRDVFWWWRRPLSLLRGSEIGRRRIREKTRRFVNFFDTPARQRAFEVARRVHARGHALIRRCAAEVEISRESWPFWAIVSKRVNTRESLLPEHELW